MGQHEEPYLRGPKGVLGEDCGHHCGVITTGQTHKIVRHCPCAECHNDLVSAVENEVEQILMPGNKSEGVDPRGIT